MRCWIGLIRDYSVSRLSAVLFVSGMERSVFPETLYLIQTINAIVGIVGIVALVI